MTGWELPTELTVAGMNYAINADYRDVLDMLRYVQDEQEPEQTRWIVALALFYEDFDRIPPADWTEAATQMMWFANGGHTESDTRPKPKLMDWEQDRALIVSDINRVAGCEVRALPFLHWWTFLAWFAAIGEGQLSAVVSIRDKLRQGKKLDDWQKQYYRDNRDRVLLRASYTEKDDATVAQWAGK